jgi:hypothetical protein
MKTKPKKGGVCSGTKNGWKPETCPLCGPFEPRADLLIDKPEGESCALCGFKESGFYNEAHSRFGGTIILCMKCHDKLFEGEE